MPYDSRMHGYCSRCKAPGRKKCTKLCDQADHYIRQDYVSQREYLLDDESVSLITEEQGQYIGNLIWTLSPREERQLETLGVTKLEVTLLKLFHVEGLPYREIAQKCNLGVPACRQRLARARARLRHKYSLAERVLNL